MSQLFEQLGLRAELTKAAAAEGLEEATPLQAAAIPVLRRGGNLVLNASAGAGVTAAYALPLLDRIAGMDRDEPGPRILILVPTDDRASRKALNLAALAQSVGLRVAALTTGWNRRGQADVIVATAEGTRAAVERSALKLDRLEALVLVDGSTQLGDARDALTSIMASVPRDAQRVVTTIDLNAEMDRFIEAHVRKAMNVPARSAEGPADIPATDTSLDYVIVPEARKEAMLVRLLEQRMQARPVVVARSAHSAQKLQESLSLRGFDTTGAGDETIRVTTAENAAGTGNEISFDVPFEAHTLAEVHAAGGLVLVTPPELPHLRRVAAAAGFALKAERVQPPAGESLSEYRRMLRQAVHDEDVDAQMAVLDPLFDEFAPAEVAAALSALLRKRAAPRATATSSQGQLAGAPKPPSAEAGFVRLFVSVGSRDNVRPGDLVGALTGEAGITGDQVGKVDIRDTFTVVEIATASAEKVIRAMNGTTMRGRSLRVDYDRKASGTAREPSREGARGGPRGGRDAGRDAGRGFGGGRGPGSGRDGGSRDGGSRDGGSRGPVREAGRGAPRESGAREFRGEFRSDRDRFGEQGAPRSPDRPPRRDRFDER